MIILDQNGMIVIDWGGVDYIFVAPPSDGKQSAVVAGCKNTAHALQILGRYRNIEQAKRVLGYMYEALKEGSAAFEFPQSEDLPDCKANYGSHVKTKRNRHGGS